MDYFFTMERQGIWAILLFLLVLCTDIRGSDARSQSGSFGDSGLYKVVIDKTRVPDVTEGTVTMGNGEVEEKTVIMHNRKGQPFRCSIPEMVKLPDEKDKLVNLTTEAVEEALVPTESNRGCVSLVTSGWWHYEFCFRKHVTQYHIEPNGAITKPVITLGIFSHAFNWSNVSTKDALRKKDRHHLQYFANGTNCDITGQQRQTRVKIYCDTSNWVTDHIESVREPESCVYEVIIYSRRLCAIPYFRKEEPAVSQIRCNPIGIPELSQKEPTVESSEVLDSKGEEEAVPKSAVGVAVEEEDKGYEGDDEEETTQVKERSSRRETVADVDDAKLFYEKAKKFAALRKEAWIPDEMLFKVLENVEKRASGLPRPVNREFIVTELVKRTAELLKHKARLNSAEQRSLAFDQAAQNVADAMRIMKQKDKDQPSGEFLLRYMSVVALLQLYIDQFLSLYDLETMQLVADIPSLDNLQQLSPTDTVTSSKKRTPINAALVASLLRKVDIVSLKPFSEEEEEVYRSLVVFGQGLMIISELMKGMDDAESVAALVRAGNDLADIQDALYKPKSAVWRPEFRQKMQDVLDQYVDIMTGFLQTSSLDDAVSDQSLEGTTESDEKSVESPSGDKLYNFGDSGSGGVDFSSLRPFSDAEEKIFDALRGTKQEVLTAVSDSRSRVEERAVLQKAVDKLQTHRDLIADPEKSLSKQLRSEFREKVIEYVDAVLTTLRNYLSDKSSDENKPEADTVSEEDTNLEETVSSETRRPNTDSKTPASEEPSVQKGSSALDESLVKMEAHNSAEQELLDTWTQSNQQIAVKAGNIFASHANMRAFVVEAEKNLHIFRKKLHDPEDRMAKQLRPEFRAWFIKQMGVAEADFKKYMEAVSKESPEVLKSTKVSVVDHTAPAEKNRDLSANSKRSTVDPSVDSKQYFKLYLEAKERFYVSVGWVAGQENREIVADGSDEMSEDETAAIRTLILSHRAALRLPSRYTGGQSDFVEKKLEFQPAWILWQNAQRLVSDEKRKFRPAVRDEMVLHLHRIRTFLENWKAPTAKRSADDENEPSREPSAERPTGTAESDSLESDDELTSDEREVITATLKSHAYTASIASDSEVSHGDPAVRKEAYRNGRLLAERARWLLRDETKNIRQSFRERMAPRVEKIADQLDRIVYQLERLEKVSTQLRDLRKENKQLELANRALQKENVDLDQWYKRFSGTIDKARESFTKDLKGRPEFSNLLPPPPKSRAVRFHDVITNMDPRKRKIKEVEDLIREKLSSFGEGIKVQLWNGDQQQERFAGMGERQLELIKRDLAGLFAAQVMGVNPQQRVVNELEENYNLEGNEEEEKGLSEKQRLVNRIMEF